MIQTFHLGAGATWPGEIALRLRPSLLKKFTKQPITIILIAGTNGKTTTAKMIDTILAQNDKKVFRNETGANLDNGILTAFLKDASYSGQLKSTYYIFEVDEATLPNLLKHVQPHMLLLLNLFRDQLDRYGEVDAIAEKWATALSLLPKDTNVLINGDDPALAFIGKHLSAETAYFGLDDPDAFIPKMQHATDSIYCPQCGNRLTYGGIYFSHLGKWACGQCGFMHPNLSATGKEFRSPMEGQYNRYNTVAAALAGRQLSVSDDHIQEALDTFKPAFGRMESILYKDREVKVLLSKNPTGFNESLRTVLASKKKGPILLVLNDQIPDGRDISWIWDVDFELIHEIISHRKETQKILVSGDRCYDLGLRLKYGGIPTENYDVLDVLSDAVEKAVGLTKADETLWILPTYSAMLETRKILTGRKIL